MGGCLAVVTTVGASVTVEVEAMVEDVIEVVGSVTIKEKFHRSLWNVKTEMENAAK